MRKRLTYITSVIIVLSLIFAFCGRGCDTNHEGTPTISMLLCETLVPADICDTHTLREVTFHESEIGETRTFRETIFYESGIQKNISKTVISIADSQGVNVASTFAQTVDDNYLTNVAITINGCNFNTPKWGESLGTISFYTPEEWKIFDIGTEIMQIWSDAVTATVCQKTTFDGGTNSDFNADCRSNPGFPGDFFSWCAVVRFAEKLCPYPWRVPTRQDFLDLDIALGGTGANRSSGSRDFVATAYINRWGGVFAGCTRYGRLSPGSFSCYWSITEHNTNYAFNLIYSRIGGVRPQDTHRKMHGLTVRCVR